MRSSPVVLPALVGNALTYIANNVYVCSVLMCEFVELHELYLNHKQVSTCNHYIIYHFSYLTSPSRFFFWCATLKNYGGLGGYEARQCFNILYVFIAFYSIISPCHHVYTCRCVHWMVISLRVEVVNGVSSYKWLFHLSPHQSTRRNLISPVLHTSTYIRMCY